MNENTTLALVSEDVLKSARILKMMLPYGSKLTDENAVALKEYSKLHGLDPVNGEVYFLVRDKKNDRGDIIGREELGIHPGIKGLRKKGKEQLREVDRQAWYTVDYIAVEPTSLGLLAADVAVAILATLRDSVSTGRYIIDCIRLQSAGFSRDEIVKMMGPNPVWQGYGVVKKSELRYLKQSPVQVAKKRAEADATKQRFDLPFVGETLADDFLPETPGEIIQEGSGFTRPAGPFVDLAFMEQPESAQEILDPNEPQYVPLDANGFPVQAQPEPAPAPAPAPAAVAEPATNGSAEVTRPYDPETLRKRMQEAARAVGASIPTDGQRAMVRYAIELCFTGDPNAEEKRHTVLAWLNKGKTSVKDLSGPLMRALLDAWLKPTMKQDGSGEYIVNQYAAQEAAAVVAAALKAEGQLDLGV